MRGVASKLSCFTHYALRQGRNLFLTHTCCLGSSFVAFQDDTTKHISKRTGRARRGPPWRCKETQHYFWMGPLPWKPLFFSFFFWCFFVLSVDVLRSLSGSTFNLHAEVLQNQTTKCKRLFSGHVGWYWSHWLILVTLVGWFLEHEVLNIGVMCAEGHWAAPHQA